MKLLCSPLVEVCRENDKLYFLSQLRCVIQLDILILLKVDINMVV